MILIIFIAFIFTAASCNHPEPPSPPLATPLTKEQKLAVAGLIDDVIKKIDRRLALTYTRKDSILRALALSKKEKFLKQ